MSSLQEPQIPASYIIFKEGNYYYAQNGKTGKIDFGGPGNAGDVDGTDASAVIQSAINALPDGGCVFIKKATYTPLSNTISIDGKNDIEIWFENGAILRPTASMTVLKINNSSRIRLYGPRVYSTVLGVVAIEVNASNFVKIFNPYLYLTKGGTSRGIYAVDVNNFLVENGYVARASYGIGVYKSNLATMYNIRILNNHVEDISVLGIHVQYCSEVIIKGNILQMISDNGIDVLNSAYFMVKDNLLVSAGNPNGHSIGIYQELDGTTHDGIVSHNIIRDYTDAFYMSPSATNVKVFKNIGYVTENSGTATITAGSTYVDVTHGLSRAPDINRIKVTPKDNLGGRSFWVSNVGATTFRINISSSDSVDHSFGWSYE